MDFLLAELSARLNLKLAVFGVVRMTTGAPVHEPLSARRVSSMSLDELKALHDFYADMHAVPDPALVACIAHMTAHPGPICVRRADQVSDDVWYASENVQKCRRAGGVDDQILAGAPAGEPGLYYATSFHRAWGAPLFSERDRDLAALVQMSVGWMFDDFATEREGERFMHDVPPRQREALIALLRGDSEKQAAKRLRITPHALHEHVKRLHRALDVASRGELLARCYALRVTPDRQENAAASRGVVAFPVDPDPDRVRTAKLSRTSARRAPARAQGRKR